MSNINYIVENERLKRKLDEALDMVRRLRNALEGGSIRVSTNCDGIQEEHVSLSDTLRNVATYSSAEWKDWLIGKADEIDAVLGEKE